jgi:serine/threonine-protein kinase
VDLDDTLDGILSSTLPGFVSVSLSKAETVEVTLFDEAVDESSGWPPHLEDRGLIGRGGMREVRRVHDTRLNRSVALKVLRADRTLSKVAFARFLEEAQATAQLAHPGVVPVHELGVLPDGRLYFTMEEIAGRPLTAVLKESLPLRRRIGIFHQVCETMAYAHDRGVLHRDLKPDNIMLGAYGEVRVLDWGLAKVLGRELLVDADAAPVVTDRTRDGAQLTVVGSVAGTPSYMAPEQANGHTGLVDFRTDTYALGAILYEILLGMPPYRGRNALDVVAQVRSGDPDPLPRLDRPGLPEGLVAICRRALTRDRDGRYASAKALAADVQAWLDGAQRRARALAVVEEARALTSRIAEQAARATALRERGDALLKGVPSWAPDTDKLAGWSLQDEADRLDARVALDQLEEEQLLKASLTHEPLLVEAHEALASLYHRRHWAAEGRGDALEADKAAHLLRSYTMQLPPDHPMCTTMQAYLQGDGWLSLRTEPADAEVVLHRYTLRGRRFVPEVVRSLGRSPLSRVRLPMGSYCLELRHPECETVRYPVQIGRQEHWDGVHPETGEPVSVQLPRRGTLGPNERYVPAGWYTMGGDPEAIQGLPARRLWVDAFVLCTFPVTHGDFIAYLDHLVDHGDEAEALARAPRHTAAGLGGQGPLVYARDEAGHFDVQVDEQGDVWERAWPVTMVRPCDAEAYAAWLAEQTGQDWRLPSEWEWEKAARGVDGRNFPWGDFHDPSWCVMRDSMEGTMLPQAFDAAPGDVSPYGLRGMAGNTRDWTGTRFTKTGTEIDTDVVRRARPDDEDLRTIRGGAYLVAPQFCRSSFRNFGRPSDRYGYVGFRLCRSLSPASRTDVHGP